MEELHSEMIGDLGIICMPGCEGFVEKVERYLKTWHDDFDHNYVVNTVISRFASGEAKGLIRESVRGKDLYIITDCFNYSVTYKMYQMDVPMSPDDHFQDLKRMISATAGKAKRITVIMPMLYEGRQHKRSSRESLDCALALQELVNMGVSNIITFDAHDPRVQNAIPLSGFDSFQPTYQMIKAMTKTVPDIAFEDQSLAIISPDEGGVSRCLYYSSVLNVNVGMFYKRRNYSVIVNGRNPIEAHEYLGNSIEGKDIIVVDDMIASGDSMLDIFKNLKERGARRIFACVSFGLFTHGLEHFDRMYEQGMFDKIFTTNLIYTPDELLEKPWYCSVDMSKYVAYIIEELNHDNSTSSLIDPAPAPVYSGWRTVGGKTYYYDQYTNQPVTGIQSIDNKLYYFDANGVQQDATFGIDVSKYQSNIDWEQVKTAGVKFVIIRIGYRGYGSGALVLDPMFEQHFTNARNAGLKVGVYFFSQAVNENEAREEAQGCAYVLNGRKLDYPIYFDTEASGGSNGRADGLGVEDRTKCAIAFCEEVKAQGYKPGVYASTLWFRKRIDLNQLKSYSIWNAHYNVAGSPIACDMWQGTCTARIPGYGGQIDVNISYVG